MTHRTSTAAKLILGAALGTFLALLTATLAVADKLDEIKARGHLIVGTSETSPPFSPRKNGKVVGYDVDLAARVAARLALPMETLSIINADRIPALQQDRVDLVASGITRADNRRDEIGFSVAYLVSPHKVLIRKDGGVAAVAQMARSSKLASWSRAGQHRRRAQGRRAHAADRLFRRLRRVLRCAA